MRHLCQASQAMFLALQIVSGCAVLTGGCNGLCDSATLVPKLHQNPNCTKAATLELPLTAAWYDYSAVGCIQMVNGNVNKTLCQENTSA